MEHKGAPTVILARTIKGYGLGEGGEGRNITHQQKKMNEEELRAFRTRFGIPISDADVSKAPFYRPAEDSPEMKYMRERAQGARRLRAEPRDRAVTPLAPVAPSRSRSSTRAPRAARPRRRWCSCGCCRSCCATRRSASCVVPIVPDEARTFGMEALFRQVGIYSHAGQLYEPVDMDTLLYYKEASDGQILEEGITEAGSMSSFIAAGTAYATHGVNTIPFFIYYSMFGFQRIGDLIWAAADSADARLHARRHRRPHDARRRRAAAPGRPQPSARDRRVRTSSPTTRRSPTRSPSSSRTASGGCTSIRRASSTTSR